MRSSIIYMYSGIFSSSHYQNWRISTLWLASSYITHTLSFEQQLSQNSLVVESGFGFYCEIYAWGTAIYDTLETETQIDGASEIWNRLDVIWVTGNVTVDFAMNKCLDLHFDCRKSIEYNILYANVEVCKWHMHL